MKLIFLTIFMISAQAFAADILGYWKLTYYIYDGQPLPLPNPDLDLKFVFYKNGISILRWSRKNEMGYCERKAIYSIEGNILHQKTIWINPRNDHSCASDPEMQANSETFTNFHIEKRFLFLELSIGDKPFVYVFNLLPDERRL